MTGYAPRRRRFDYWCGRCRSRSKSLPLPIEVGAEFIHGKPDEIWRVVADCHLPVSELTGDNACLEGSDLLQCNEFWTDCEKISQRMRLASGRDESFLSFIDRLVAEKPHLERARRRAIEFVEYVPVGQLNARHELALPISETVFFAGEATNTVGFAGTVHGAIQTGRRAAKEVIDVLKSVRRVA